MSESRYRILRDDDGYDLTCEVEKYLREGWELSGGISVTYEHDNDRGYNIGMKNVYFQAIYKPAEVTITTGRAVRRDR